jgi:hypothetical protein
MTRELPFLFVCSLSIFAAVASAQFDDWQTGDPVMPYAAAKQAIGYEASTQTIWLLGGWDFTQNAVSYSIEQNEFTQYEGALAPFSYWGFAQSYAQVGHLVYMLTTDTSTQPSTTELYSFDMLTMNVTLEATISLDRFNSNLACLASITARDGNHYLFMNNGEVSAVLNLTDKTWMQLDDIPMMNTPRSFHSCVAVGDYLYAIGRDTNTVLSPIERLYVGDMQNIGQQQWSVDADLVQPVRNMRLTVVGAEIFVMGGYNGSSYTDSVQVVDTSTEPVTVTVAGHYPFVVHSLPVVATQSALYAFGGHRQNDVRMDDWFWHDLEPVDANEDTNKEEEEEELEEEEWSGAYDWSASENTLDCDYVVVDHPYGGGGQLEPVMDCMNTRHGWSKRIEVEVDEHGDVKVWMRRYSAPNCPDDIVHTIDWGCCVDADDATECSIEERDDCQSDDPRRKYPMDTIYAHLGTGRECPSFAFSTTKLISSWRGGELELNKTMEDYYIESGVLGIGCSGWSDQLWYRDVSCSGSNPRKRRMHWRWFTDSSCSRESMVPEGEEVTMERREDQTAFYVFAWREGEQHMRIYSADQQWDYIVEGLDCFNTYTDLDG